MLPNYATRVSVLIMTISAYEAGTPPPILLRQRLRIAREHAGLEQDELADMIGVSRNTISNAESGKVHPRRITLNAIALATGVPVSWFLEGDEDGQSGPGGGAGQPDPPGPTPITAVAPPGEVSGQPTPQPVGYNPSTRRRAA